MHPLATLSRNVVFAFRLLPLILLCVVSYSLQAQPRYIVQDLDVLNGPTSYAYGINNKGQVVGGAFFGFAQYIHPFLWENGVLHDLGLTGGYNAGQAYAINDHGHVVGTLSEVTSRSFLWKDGHMQFIDPADTYLSWIGNINNTGQVVGIIKAGYYAPPLGYLWENGATHMLPTPYPNDSMWGAVINDFGMLGVNIWVGGPTALIAYRGINGIYERLAAPDYYNQVTAINNAGQLAGVYFPSRTYRATAIRWEPSGRYTVIGGLLPDPLFPGEFLDDSIAYALNDNGDVVGRAGNVPFLWKDGTLYNLAELTDVDNENILALSTAYGINNAGQIVGYGIVKRQDGGYPHALLYTPVDIVVDSSKLVLKSRDESSGELRQVDGIVCDNLRGMSDDQKNCLIIPIPNELQGATLNLRVSNTRSGVDNKDEAGLVNVGCATVIGNDIRYYPPDEFNFRQEPRDGHPEDITKSAIRSVYLKVSGERNGKRISVHPKEILIARPVVLLVHGINSKPNDWQPLTAAVKADGKRIPFVAVNHADIDSGNGPVEVAAKRLRDNILYALNAVRSGADLLGINGDTFSDYRGKKIACRRVDVLAWSYGGVITRWYIASRGSEESYEWYKRQWTLPSAPNRPTTNFTTDGQPIRKVITLGSMWRGVPLANYVNEAQFSRDPNLLPENGTNLSQARFYIPPKSLLPRYPSQWTLGQFMDTWMEKKVATRVPSMEVMAVESLWMRQLIYHHMDAPEPFDNDIAYGSIGGDDNNYPLPIYGITVQPDPYSVIHKLQQPSWFPGLADEVRQGSQKGFSDGLVPLWSALLPDVHEESMLDSFVVVPCDHASYPGNQQTIGYVLRFLHHAAVKTGTTLNHTWQEATELKVDEVRRWPLVANKMAPGDGHDFLQNDYYGNYQKVGRINPAWLAVDVEPEIGLIGGVLVRHGDEIHAEIKVTHPNYKVGRMIDLQVSRLGTSLTQKRRSGSLDAYPANVNSELRLGHLINGATIKVTLIFRPDPIIPSFRPGDRVDLKLTVQHSRKSKPIMFQNLLIP